MECPYPVVEYNWDHNNGTYDNHYGISLLWHGGFYSEDYDGFINGISLACAGDSESPWYAWPPSNIRGQRYKIETEDSDVELWFGTADHRHGVYPASHEEDHHWAKKTLEIAIDEISDSAFGVPVTSLVDMLYADDDGFSRLPNAMEYSNTDSTSWSECCHTNAIIIESDLPAPDFQVSQGFYSDVTIPYWNDVDYEITSFDPDQGPELNINKEFINFLNNKTPNELSIEQRRKIGIKEVQEKYTIESPDGEEISVDYLMTKNPYKVTESPNVKRRKK